MMRILAGSAAAILCLASITSIGWLLARALRAGEAGDGETLGDKRPSESEAARPGLGWAFLLGAAAVGLALQIPLAIDGRISHRSFALVGLIGLAALAWTLAIWWRRGPGNRRIPWGWLADLPMIGRLLALVSIAAAFVYCCRTDLIGYDARSIYALKARILYDTGTIRGEDFQDIERVHFNPGYPLLAPLLEAQEYWTQGGDRAAGLKLLFLAFPLALASIFAAHLRRYGGKGMAATLALIVFLTPASLECFEGAGISGSADWPLAALVFAAVLEISRWIRRADWRPAVCAALLLGAAASTKAEGMSWIAACTVGLVGTWLLRAAMPTRRRLAARLATGLPAALATRLPAALGGGLAGGGALLLLLGLRQAIARQVPASPYYPSYLAALDWTWIKQLADRPPVVFRYALAELFRVKTWNLVWPCVLGSLVLLRRGRLPAEVWFWRLTAAAGIAAALLALVITPLHLGYELLTSFSRLLLPAFPLAMLIMSEQLAASGWSREVAETMRVEPSAAHLEQTAAQNREAPAQAA